MRLSRPRSRMVILVALAGAAVGCGPGRGNPQIPPPGPPAFQDGYLAGCPSGFTDAGRDGYQQSYRKDLPRYAGEADYRQGWDQGHAACYEEEKRHPKIIGAGGVHEFSRGGSMSGGGSGGPGGNGGGAGH